MQALKSACFSFPVKGTSQAKSSFVPSSTGLQPAGSAPGSDFVMRGELPCSTLHNG